jgi:hypothetical protein
MCGSSDFKHSRESNAFRLPDDAFDTFFLVINNWGEGIAMRGFGRRGKGASGYIERP